MGKQSEMTPLEQAVADGDLKAIAESKRAQEEYWASPEGKVEDLRLEEEYNSQTVTTTRGEFERVMLEVFTGTGNEYDEEEDLEAFRGTMDEVWSNLQEGLHERDTHDQG